jgi:RNA polymerase sigma-70 factor (ECF subfamily)
MSPSQSKAIFAIKSAHGRVFLDDQAGEGAMEPVGQRLAAGEPDAFAALYGHLATRCHHYLVAKLRCRDAADEVLQDIFVRLVRQRDRLAGVENLTAYVFAVARNEVARFCERRGREGPRQSLAAEDVFLEAKSDDPARRDEAECAARALEQLADDVREIVELKIYGGLTFREIAELLEMPQGTVATRYRTALARLKDWFARQPS